MKKQLLFSLLFITITVFYGQNNTALDSLKKIVSKAPSKAIKMGDSIIKLKNISTIEKNKIIFYQALAYQNNKNYKEAISYLNKINTNLNSIKDKKFYINVLLSLSNSNVYLNNFTTATTQALEALKIAKENKFNDLIASSNSALSFLYYKTGNYLEALEYLSNSASIFIKESKDTELSGVYNNMAILYKKIGEFNTAIDYNKKSLSISIKNDDFLGIGKSYSNIGRIYTFVGEYKIAIGYYKKAIENNKKNNIINSIPYTNIAEVYGEMNNLKKAEYYYQKALKIVLENQTNTEIKNIYNDLLKIAITNKDYKKAYNYQQKLLKVEQKIKKHSNEEKLKMIENQHLLTQKKQELLAVKEKTKNQLILFSTLTILFLFLGVLFIQKQKNSKLKNEKEKMVLEQRVLRSQMNPHFIFNSLAAIQNSLLDNKPIESATYLSRFAKLIRQNFDFINKKHILLYEEIDSLKNYLDTQKMRFQNKFDYEINIFADVDMQTVNIPPLLLQPFVENAIEHGFKNKKDKGKIIINISKNQNNYCYEIIDNGKGISEIKKENKMHAIDIFKKRLLIRNKKEEKFFKIISSEKGTTVKFCLKND